jgi:hypothetical protein
MLTESMLSCEDVSLKSKNDDPIKSCYSYFGLSTGGSMRQLKSMLF